MSHFPNPEEYSLKQSLIHLEQLPSNSKAFILKKAKGVYLYDIDENKYTDFDLNKGTIFTEHSPKRLSKFIKNVLSAGLNTCGFYHKFTFKAQKYWKKITEFNHVGFHTSFIEMILAVINTLNMNKTKICIGYTTEDLYLQLLPLSNIISLKKINSSQQITDINLLLIEEFNDDLEVTKINNSTIPIIKIHSRFLFRTQGIKKERSFELEYLHFITTTPFGGKTIGVLASNVPINYTPSSFDDGILYLEGAKLFLSLSLSSTIQFTHPQFDCYQGFAKSHVILDTQFFLKRGIYIQENILYFSPYHTKHDFRRLNQALKEYFTPTLNDTLDQK